MSNPTVRYEQCGLDFFQLIAMQCNIRYAGGVSFPPTAVATVTSIWYQTVLQLGVHNQIGLAKLPNDPTKARPIMIRQIVDMSPGAKISVNFAQPSRKPGENKTLGEVMTENIYQNDLPKATGPSQLFIYTNQADQATSLVVNLSAACWDATTIKKVLGKFMLNLQATLKTLAGEPVEKPPLSKYSKLAGWAKVLQDSMAKDSLPDPKYLPIQQEDGIPVAKIADILPLEDGEVLEPKDRRLLTEVDGETVAACTAVVQELGANLNGFGSACMQRALAEAYFRRHPDHPAVTIAQADQLDPRKMMDESEYYLHAIGVLTHGRTFQRKELEDSHDKVKEWLLQEAKRWEAEVQKRLDRGEGKRKTLELITNTIDRTNQVQPAIEMVDHGIYDTPSEEWSIELGHRFDLCELMSVVVHLERASGSMKLEMQLGKDQGRTSTVALLERCNELWKIVANTI